ncbi:hypothetical protein [Streptomyces sp. 058-1L]|uniref:hypothetical protein n=1 Tax=Streptomyces sp. 058-1L TaxID=2789266 RepID=UPI00397FA035
MADMTYLSSGSAPTAPAGDLVRDADGCCPPAVQHPRIMTDMVSGGEAALHAYYAVRDFL